MSSSEEQLAEKLKDYQALVHEDKNIDVSALVLNALETQKSSLVSPKQKKWAYLVSIGLPPFGLLFALKFFLDDEDDAKSTALICVALTIVSIVVTVITIKSLFSGAGVTPAQIEQINPKDVIDLTR